MKRILFTHLLLLLIISVMGQDKSLFLKKVLVQGKDSLPFRILYPVNYNEGKKYPLILFLHGAGERGNDNESQLTWGANLFLDSTNREKFPAIVIFPQCPKDSSWAAIVRGADRSDSLGGFTIPAKDVPTKPMELVMGLVNGLVKQKKVDEKRLYVGGLSMGGFGTFDILWRMPKFFAAAFPICGGGNPDKVALYAKEYPIWIFHGGSDPVVAVGNSHLMVRVLREAGAKVKYSEYPGVGHDSWKNALAEPDLLSWIFSNKK